MPRRPPLDGESARPRTSATFFDEATAHRIVRNGRRSRARTRSAKGGMPQQVVEHDRAGSDQTRPPTSSPIVALTVVSVVARLQRPVRTRAFPARAAASLGRLPHRPRRTRAGNRRDRGRRTWRTAMPRRRRLFATLSRAVPRSASMKFAGPRQTDGAEGARASAMASRLRATSRLAARKKSLVATPPRRYASAATSHAAPRGEGAMTRRSEAACCWIGDATACRRARKPSKSEPIATTLDAEAVAEPETPFERASKSCRRRSARSGKDRASSKSVSGASVLPCWIVGVAEEDRAAYARWLAVGAPRGRASLGARSAVPKPGARRSPPPAHTCRSGLSVTTLSPRPNDTRASARSASSAPLQSTKLRGCTSMGPTRCLGDRAREARGVIAQWLVLHRTHRRNDAFGRRQLKKCGTRRRAPKSVGLTQIVIGKTQGALARLQHLPTLLVEHYPQHAQTWFADRRVAP